MRPKPTRGKKRTSLTLAQKLEKKARQWNRFYGYGYTLSEKQRVLQKLLEAMERSGVLGKVIIDAGSGSLQARDYGHTQASNIFYPTRGKKIIRIDVSHKQNFRRTKNIAEIRADIENLAPRTFAQKRKLIEAARFLGVNPRQKIPPVDTIVLSDILNYVDFRKTINGLAQYLKKGGRIIIMNRPGRGYKSRFSKRKGVKTNTALEEFLMQNNFEIEHIASTYDGEATEYPSDGIPKPKDFLILVAKKL